MDKQLIEEKLESLRRSISRIEGKYPTCVDSLPNDLDAQDIITLNLTRAVQLCVDIAAHIVSEAKEITPPATMAESFTRLNELGVIDKTVETRMIKAVGFRNIAVHHYEAIDWNIVKSICERHLDDFKNFARMIDSILQ